MVLAGMSSLALQAQTTNLINDGTTIANLVLLQNEHGAGTPPAGLTLASDGTLLEAAQTPAYSDFPLSGVWYDSRYSVTSGSYTVQAEVRPAASFPEYVTGVMAWLDLATRKGIAFRLAPSAPAPFQVATLDFAATTFEANDSADGLYELDGSPAVAGPGSAWATGEGYAPDLAAIVSLTIAPPTSADTAAVPGATARLTARVYQGGAAVGEAIELLTTLPVPTSHRFGYFATWGISLFAGELIGYLDNLQFAGSLKIENQAPMVAITSPADNSVFNVPQDVTLAVTATDPEGRLSRIELYRSDTLIATTNHSPASFVVSGLAVGNYSFRARAVDELGAVADSSVVRVEMRPPLQPPHLENPRALPGPLDFRDFTFRATGLSGGSYRVETTVNFAQWTTVASGAITGATMEFTFPRSPGGNSQIYRLVVLP